MADLPLPPRVNGCFWNLYHRFCCPKVLCRGTNLHKKRSMSIVWSLATVLSWFLPQILPPPSPFPTLIVTCYQNLWPWTKLGRRSFCQKSDRLRWWILHASTWDIWGRCFSSCYFCNSRSLSFNSWFSGEVLEEGTSRPLVFFINTVSVSQLSLPVIDREKHTASRWCWA